MLEMNNSPLPFGIDRSLLRLDGKDLYLCLHFIMIFVRDQERSLRFYVDRLGFRLVVDQQFESSGRWIEVAPADGTASIALVLGAPGSDAEKLVGRDTQAYFITEDVGAKFNELTSRGVRFQSSPHEQWGGVFTRFEDVDGNSFGLVGFDDLTRGIESQRLALARKLESERRAAQEIEIAKQVQARLFPQIHPKLRTLAYAGVCVQARQVGGDYFDFLDLGREQLGLVIGDVSGKGIAAALLMANLQANLRSQCTAVQGHPDLLLRSVNHLFYENTVDSAYASLFFAEYNDNARRLRYANCGHLPGLLVQSDETIKRLDSTGTPLGLFEDWDCCIQECDMAPGDTLVLYTDGVTEAANYAGEEFGERRLITALKQPHNSCEDLLSAVLGELAQFSSCAQLDDITLIVAKCQT
jgi:phosphoserine phosphatase RsbU/P